MTTEMEGSRHQEYKAFPVFCVEFSAHRTHNADATQIIPIICNFEFLLKSDTFGVLFKEDVKMFFNREKQTNKQLQHQHIVKNYAFSVGVLLS